MPDSVEDRGSSQSGRQTLSPPVLAARVLEEQESAVAVPDLVDSSEFADDESPAFREEITSVLTSLASMSFLSSALFHLFVWGTAIILLPLFGFDWLEFAPVEVQPLTASLGDDEVLDDLPNLDIVGSVDIETDDGSSSLQELAQQLQKSDSVWLNSVSEEVFSMSSPDANGDGEGSDGILLKVPSDGFAVTKGSFTAFTIPAEPEPLKPYRIVIEVRLPSDVKKYRVNDLKGEVIGTDGYRQFLPFDKDARNATRSPAANGKEIVITSSASIDVIKNRVQIIIIVPGARELVKDQIKIRSRRLKEDQELTLTFGRPKALKPDASENP